MTSTIILIAAVGIFLAAGLLLWYAGVNTAFSTAGTHLSTITGNMTSNIP